MRAASLFLREIRIEHTLFALPFAYVGAVFAARGLPHLAAVVWITLAVLGARTAAMAANRYFDRDIDARTPRTARRALATGELAPSVMLAAVAVGLLLLLVAAWQLNPLCVELLPIAAAGVLLYPLCKRFTWMVHIVLGAVDGLAPLGAYIGIAGRIDATGIALFAAVTLWVAGFDILYALMDLPADRENGVNSMPVRFGEKSARPTAIAMHVGMFALIAIAGRIGGLDDSWYIAGLVATAALIAYELRLLRTSENVFLLNERIFSANMTYSVIFLITVAFGFGLRA